MKILRILTGTHAGTQARLTPGQYRIGKEDDADICVTDWDVAPIVVTLHENGVIDAREASAASGDPSVVLIPDFVPFPFGITALCFGAEDTAWPPDIQLLASMYAPPAASRAGAQGSSGADVAGAERGSSSGRPVRGRASRIATMAVLLIALLAAGGSVVAAVWLRSPSTPLPHSADDVAALLRRQLRDAQLAGLRVRAQGDTVVIDGMVNDASQDIAVRDLLARTGYHDIARQYDVAHADVASIDELLAEDNVHTRYAGEGVFVLSGAAASLTRFQDALSRLTPDLSANVKRLDVDVTESPPTAPLAYSSMLDVGGTRYVQTQDGVKHLFAGGAAGAADGPHVLHESIVPNPGGVH